MHGLAGVECWWRLLGPLRCLMLVSQGDQIGEFAPLLRRDPPVLRPALTVIETVPRTRRDDP